MPSSLKNPTLGSVERITASLLGSFHCSFFPGSVVDLFEEAVGEFRACSRVDGPHGHLPVAGGSAR